MSLILRNAGIGVNVHYILSMNNLLCLILIKKNSKGEKYYNSCISLPLYPELTNQDLCFVRQSQESFGMLKIVLGTAQFGLTTELQMLKAKLNLKKY